MVTRTANTAVGTATLPPAEKPLDDLEARLLRYRTSTTVFRSMVKNGILTEVDCFELIRALDSSVELISCYESLTFEETMYVAYCYGRFSPG